MAAASDLAPAIPAISEQVKRNLKVDLRVSVGSSGQLARQVEQGAPFDLFLSADEDYVRQVVATGRGDAGTVRVYATGRLALWSKGGTVRRLEDLGKPEVKRVAMANPAHAPYGRLARAALERMGLWKLLEPKIVLTETVRQTMQFAGTGNVDAALTSWTLAHDQGGVLLGDSMRQAGVVIRGSRRAAEARAVLDFLVSAAGREVLGRYGFLPGEALLEDLQNNHGDRKGGGTDKETKKAEGFGAAKKRNKNK